MPETRASAEQVPIGVGVLGLGFMGRTHAAAYRAAEEAGLPCRLIAGCDRETRRRSGATAPDDPGPPFDPRGLEILTEADELLADSRISLVSICTPTDTHLPLALAALAAGKHVLLEKPVALHAEDVRCIIRAADAAGRRCMPAMCMRFWPGWDWLHERIVEGTFGAVQRAHFERRSAFPAWAPEFYGNSARSGGALFDLHVHDADFVHWCFGRPASVTSTGTIDSIRTEYRYEDGPKVTAAGAWTGDQDEPFAMRFDVRFEGGEHVGFDLHREPPLVVTGSALAPPPGIGSPGDAYLAEIRHLVEVLAGAGGPRRLAATLEDAATVTEMLEAERRSLESGTAISLPLSPALG